MQPTASEESRALESVRRCCYAGLDSVAFRQEATRRLSTFLPFDAHNFALTWPGVSGWRP